MLLQPAFTKELVKFQLVHKMLVTTSSSPLLTLLNSFSVIRCRIQSQVPAAAADTTLWCPYTWIPQVGYFLLFICTWFTKPTNSHNHVLYGSVRTLLPASTGSVFWQSGTQQSLRSRDPTAGTLTKPASSYWALPTLPDQALKATHASPLNSSYTSSTFCQDFCIIIPLCWYHIICSPAFRPLGLSPETSLTVIIPDSYPHLCNILHNVALPYLLLHPSLILPSSVLSCSFESKATDVNVNVNVRTRILLHVRPLSASTYTWACLMPPERSILS